MQATEASHQKLPAAAIPAPGPLSPDDVLRFHRDGFLVVRSVLTSGEVKDLRQAIQAFGQRAKALGHVLRPQTGEIVPLAELMAQPGVGWLLSDPRVIGLARQLLGGPLVYFGDSGTMLGGKLRGFHKDNTVRDDAAHPDWQSPYTLLRIGFYLQDHSRHSGGLKVRRASHLHVDVNTGAIVDVPTRPGDLVVWSLRTTHSGHAVRVRGLPFLKLQPRFEARLPRWLHTAEEQPRVAAFLTLGLDDHHLRAYVGKHTDLAAYPNNYLFNQWRYANGTAEAAARLAAAGVTLLRPVPEYGEKFGAAEPVPEGFVGAGPGLPDVYPARGLEAWIRGAGRVLRALHLAS